MGQNQQSRKQWQEVANIPRLLLGPHDMIPLCQVVRAYLAYLRREVPSSGQRHRQIQALQRVQAMLLRAQAKQAREEITVLLQN